MLPDFDSSIHEGVASLGKASRSEDHTSTSLRYLSSVVLLSLP